MMPDRGDRQPGNLLRRVLDEPSLVAAVRSLEPRALRLWVERVGLEDASDLVALASEEQLLDLFDASLWKSENVGGDEHFDPARFATWLEVLLETGEEAAARRFIEMPEELLALSLHSQMLVLDVDALFADLARAGGRLAQEVEAALESSLTFELDRYLLVSRRHEGWDALVTILTVLDRDQNQMLGGLLERCCAASADYVDDEGGLLAVLTSAEMLEIDAAADREDRRARQGYVSPADARAFLALARAQSADELLAQIGPDPLTRAYFRAHETRPAPTEPAAPRGSASASAAPADDSGERLLAALREAEILPAAQPLLAPPEQKLDVFRAALARLAELDPAAHAQRMDELAYLANVLIAGASRGARAYRPVEAVEAVIETCTAGLAHLLGGPPGEESAVDALARCRADRLFLAGWRLRSR
jgi:Family of unknown function (DUF6178)